MKSEKLFIETPDGEKIAAVVHYPDQRIKGSILLQHGFFSDKEGRYKKRAEYFAGQGFRAVRFDRRGYGESDLSFNQFNTTTGIEDTIGIIDFLEKKVENDFAVHGSSFGGFIGIFAAANDPRIDWLVLRSPVTYTNGIFDELRTEVKKRGKVELEQMNHQYIDKSFFADLDSYNVESVLDEIEIPTLIFHGTDDKVVPLEYSKRFYRNLRAEKELVEINGEGHIFDVKKDQATLKQTANWLDKQLSS